MISEQLVIRLCAACVRQTRFRTLWLTRKASLHALSSIHASRVVRADCHRRLFGTSVVLQNKPADEFDVTQNPFFEKYRDKLKHLQE